MTNQYGRDDYYTEGNVEKVEVTDTGLAITIALTRNEHQVVMFTCSSSECPSVRVGDYLEAEGEKESEALFLADTISIKRL